MIWLILTSLKSKSYRRQLIVRAIEDAVVFLMLGVMIAVACVVFTGIFRFFGVL